MKRGHLDFDMAVKHIADECKFDSDSWNRRIVKGDIADALLHGRPL
jgi:hypothetical protein